MHIHRYSGSLIKHPVAWIASWRGNDFRITGPLGRESTGDQHLSATGMDADDWATHGSRHHKPWQWHISSWTFHSYEKSYILPWLSMCTRVCLCQAVDTIKNLNLHLSIGHGDHERCCSTTCGPTVALICCRKMIHLLFVYAAIYIPTVKPLI